MLPDGLTTISQDPVDRDAFPSSAEVSVLPDGLTAISQDPDHRDAFPSSAEVSDHRDGFPRAGVMEYSTVFLRDFHTGENSERVRESDSGVQIVPASGSPSELSAHQMGLSLAGASRLKDEPIHLFLVLPPLLLKDMNSSQSPIGRSCGNTDRRVDGKRVLGNQKLNMGLYQLFGGLMGTLHKRI